MFLGGLKKVLIVVKKPQRHYNFTILLRSISNFIGDDFMGTRKEIEMPADLFEIATVEYDNKWASRTVTVKRFTYGDTVQLQQDSIKVKANQLGAVNADVNVADLQVLTILRGVVGAPWQVNEISAVKELPPMVAEWVRNQIDEFNTITVKKKE